MEENLQANNSKQFGNLNPEQLPPKMKMNNKLIILFSLLGVILVGSVVYFSYSLSQLSRNEITQKPSTEEARPQTMDLPTAKLVYNSKGKLNYFDFKDNKEIDLGLSGVTSFLWSKNGQLAVLVQGEYGGNRSFLRIPKVFATTEGFNYLLYLVDLEGKKPKLILPEVFGEVFWSEDSTGFYVSENYRAGKPILLGEQSGLQSDEIKTFFVSLDGIQKPIDRKVFDKETIRASGRIAPDSKFHIKSGGLTDFAKIVEIESGSEYSLKPGAYMTRTSNAKWSPNGKKIAFIYKVSDEATKNSILNITTLDEILAQNFSDKLKGSLPSAESVDFDWIDDQSIVVSQLNYISQPGHYQGNIGVYDVSSDKFRVLVSSIAQQVPYSNTLLSSPDKKFFTYQTSRNLGGEEIIISNLEGKEIKKLSGRDPSWEPLK